MKMLNFLSLIFHYSLYIFKINNIKEKFSDPKVKEENDEAKKKKEEWLISQLIGPSNSQNENDESKEKKVLESVIISRLVNPSTLEHSPDIFKKVTNPNEAEYQSPPQQKCLRDGEIDLFNHKTLYTSNMLLKEEMTQSDILQKEVLCNLRF